MPQANALEVKESGGSLQTTAWGWVKEAALAPKNQLPPPVTVVFALPDKEQQYTSSHREPGSSSSPQPATSSHHGDDALIPK